MPLNCATAVCNPQVDAATNRLVGYVFDQAGNTKTDANGQTFIYDAENKQTLVRNASNQIVGEYTYDGDGKRVKKVVAATGETTVFVYDASGKMVAEYSTVMNTTPQVSYLTSDHLGSPRINTDANGVVIARHDYEPFGEEIQRTSYGGDAVRKQFETYERDNETDLDFAEARMYNFKHGRFAAVDPYNIILEVQAETDKEKAQGKLIGYISKPQQWNRYVYVANNPLSYIDPTGELLELTGTQAEKDRSLQRLRELLGKDADIGTHIVNGKTYVTAKGSLRAAAGDVGQVVQDIINSRRTTVEFQVTNKDSVTDANGDTLDLKNEFAKTQIIDNTKIQIFIKDNQAGNVTVKLRSLWDTDGSLTPLKFTELTILAHELGHAWGGIVDNYYQKVTSTDDKRIWAAEADQNRQRSVQVENWQRMRLGLSLRSSHD